ncbi:ribosome recycling factor family protein [Vibrio sp. M260118]|uniref:ribosome recycling factor family protein n=1 Tax=Vibrio sp. M260118 TaxID=3020896 RepID=UPI002F3FFEBC
MISVPLNSFVHRVPDKSIVLSLASENGCQLKRVRRSRNWQLNGEEQQLRILATQLDLDAHRWIVEAIDKALPKPIVNLADLLAHTPNMTVNQLVAESGCSLKEARQAIDEFELL